VEEKTMPLTFIHSRLANTTVFYFLALAIWGLFTFLMAMKKRRTEKIIEPIESVISSSYWGALIIGEILVIVQGLIGIILWFTGVRPERGWFHILYGIVAVLCIPAVYAYTKGQDRDKEMLIYGVVMLFAFGIALRAIATGV
jgi:phosphoglycerol transferase MdoB-like AlkP superfamily enzyme